MNHHKAACWQCGRAGPSNACSAWLASASLTTQPMPVKLCCAPRSAARQDGAAAWPTSSTASWFTCAGATMDEYIEAERWDAYNRGDTDFSPVPPRLIDMRRRVPPDHPAHQAVDRVLAAAWSLAATTKPPPGSVRIRMAWPGKARMVRATGDGWTLIGRTDGPVVLLADAVPGLPIDIEDAPGSMSYSLPLLPQPRALAAEQPLPLSHVRAQLMRAPPADRTPAGALVSFPGRAGPDHPALADRHRVSACRK